MVNVVVALEKSEGTQDRQYTMSVSEKRAKNMDLTVKGACTDRVLYPANTVWTRGGSLPLNALDGQTIV